MVSIHAPTRGATRPSSPGVQPGKVSIHAPTRGATQGQRADDCEQGVSIHAPTRGATGANIYSGHIGAGFNPRTHTGCDSTCPLQGWIWLSFNPRTHTGCDYLLMTLIHFKLWFQSTHPHGVRRRSISRDFAGYRFQSTHPHGVRQHFQCKSPRGVVVSIHAPTRGATRRNRP